MLPQSENPAAGAFSREAVRLADLIEAIAVPVVAATAAGELLLANHAFRMLASHVQGRPADGASSLPPPDCVARFFANLSASGATDCEGEVVVRGGPAAETRLRVLWRRVDMGAAAVYLGTALGSEAAGWLEEKARLESRIRALEETNRTLEAVTEWTREVKASAELASTAKNMFLANISHEIRTPMNGILGLTELALSTELTPEQREYLTIVRSSAESMLNLLNDILDLAKCEAGKMTLHPVVFRLREQLAWTLRPIAIRARSKGLAFLVEVDPLLPEELYGDAARIRQVLTNLAGNAVKFTDQGRITVSVRKVSEDAQTLDVRFSVSDTGIGIPKEKQELVFEPFTQVDDSLARRHGGTGLGLPICRSLVRLMGGEITLHSEPGAGSTFEFTIRLARHNAEEPTNQSTPAEREGEEFEAGRPRRRLRILAVDDHPVNQLIVRRFLSRLGHEVSLASSGEEAVERVKSNAYDIVLMDVQMPGLDGLASTSRIRAWEASANRPRTPIIAMTAHSMPGDRERFLSAGMDGYVSKPLHLGELAKMIDELDAPRSQQVEGAPLPRRESTLLFEREAALARVGGDEDLLRDIAAIFLDEYQGSLETVEAAAGAGDAKALERAAHHLKGSVANFSSEAREAAFALERMGRTGDMRDLPEALSRLRETVERLRLDLERYLAEGKQPGAAG